MALQPPLKPGSRPTSEVDQRIPPFYKYTQCRINHLWILREGFPTRADTGGWNFLWDCIGPCKGIKRVYANHRGIAHPAYYILPKDYKLEKGLVKADFRIHLVHQVIDITDSARVVAEDMVLAVQTRT